MGLDLVRPDPERHGALRLTENARPLLRGEATLELRADSLKRAARTTIRSAPAALVDEADEGMLAALKSKRRALADAQGVPAYVIFPDRTLIEMASRRPQSLDDMRGVTGVGAVKLERFGPDFLAVLTGEHQAPVHPARRKLAGQPSGEIFDRLHAAQVALARGPDGRDKYLSCTPSTLAKIAAERPRTLSDLEGVSGVGPQKAERFGAVFLDILRATT
jgi:ATP-dependent DNA helicase RecQ